MKKCCFITLFYFMMNMSYGQVVAWDFLGAIGDEPVIAPTTVDPHLTASSISRGAGVNASTLANGYSANGWGAVNLADAITANEYFQFSLQVNTSYQASLATLNANFRRSGTGPNGFQWQYSFDGFLTAGLNMGAAISYTGTATAGDAQVPVNLAAIGSLQDLPAGTIITIRLYGWGASALSGTFALGRLAGNDLSIAGSNIVVPVLITNFSGYREACCNQLRWSTVTEINNLGFEVQHSPDGISYSVIGFVNWLAPGGNSSNPLTYFFVDNDPIGNKQYYRLRQVDIDSRSKFSPVLLINSKRSLTFGIGRIFPNPSGTTMNMIIDSPSRDRITIMLADFSGRVVLQKMIEVKTGSNTVPVDISRLADGSYLVKLVSGSGETASSLFIKRE